MSCPRHEFEAAGPGDAPHARRENPGIPAWESDRLDATAPPEIEDPYFDESLNAWVLSKYADVLAAFRSSSLYPIGPNSNAGAEPPDERVVLEMRRETLDALSPAQLRGWREQMAPFVEALVNGLPTDRSVDLMDEYAQPLCLRLAAMVTGIELGDAQRLAKVAKPVSESAAEPYDAALRSLAKSANTDLRTCFHAGPIALRDPGFVALAHTLPCLLANAWFALLRQPEQWSILHHEPGLMEQAIDELLRYAGLTRILFRRAAEDTNLNGFEIRKGQRIVLRIVAANRDPERFAYPDMVDVERPGRGHLALGAAGHSCVGASLIRMATVMISQPLLERFSHAMLIDPVEWRGGSGFRSPATLPVMLKQPLSLKI